MPELRDMPPIMPLLEELKPFGQKWINQNETLDKETSIALGRTIETRVGERLAVMLGGIRLYTQTKDDLTPPKTHCVEKGEITIVGGVRQQNFDVAYRPDGVRFAFDVKSLI